jgi:hypothetical protein
MWLITLTSRQLTNAERDDVVPLVTKIEQLRLAIAGSSRGGAWTNQRKKELRAVEHKLAIYLFWTRSLKAVTWIDERGRQRQLEFLMGKNRVKLILG